MSKGKRIVIGDYELDEEMSDKLREIAEKENVSIVEAFSRIIKQAHEREFAKNN